MIRKKKSKKATLQGVKMEKKKLRNTRFGKPTKKVQCLTANNTVRKLIIPRPEGTRRGEGRG